MSDVLRQMRERGENALTNKVRELDALMQTVSRGATGQGDASIAVRRLYNDCYMSAALKIVTIIPRESGQVSLYGDNGFDDFILPTSLTLDFATGTSGKKHAIYLYVDPIATATVTDNPKIVAEFEAWTNETTRATTLDNVQGVLLKASDYTRRWIGDAYYDGTAVSVFGGVDPLQGQFYGTGDPNNLGSGNTTGAGIQMPGVLIGGTRWNFYTLMNDVLQVGFNVLGQLVAGGGAVTIDANGSSILVTTGASDTRAYKFTDGTFTLGGLYGYKTVSKVSQQILASGGAVTKDSEIFILASSTAAKNALISIQAAGGGRTDVRIDLDTLYGLLFYSPLYVAESVTPATLVGFSAFYSKSDKKPYFFDSAGLETRIPLGSGTVTGTNTGDETTATIAAKAIEDAINDGTTNKAPSENAVFDALALKAPLASPALTGTPTAPTQSSSDNSTAIATTAFVVANMNNFDIKLAVRAASQSNLAFTRAANIYTATSLGVLLKATIDGGWSTGAALAVGDRLLLANQTSAIDNGIVTITNLGTIGTNAVLTRATDMDVDAEVTAEMRVPVTEGTDANIDYKLSSAGPFTLNTTTLPFTRAGGPPTGAAGGSLSGTYPNPNVATNANLTGDVTSSGNATTIGAGKVTLAMQANMATASVVYRKTAGSGAPEINTLATLAADLAPNTTFTPVVAGSTSAGTGTYSVQLGAWWEMGKLTFFEIDLAWSAHTGTGNLNITGLPRTAANNGINPPVTVMWSNITLLAVGNKITGLVNANNTVITFQEVGSGAQSALPLDTAATLRISGFYIQA